jgi:adenylate cyclase
VWCVLAGVLLSRFGLLHSLEGKSADLRFAMRGPLAPDPEILIIAVDEKTFQELGLKYPFPPILYAQLIEQLNRDQAATIAFDFLYSEPTRECDPPDQDGLLARTIRTGGNVIWAFELFEGNAPVFPIPVIRESVTGIGYINMPDEPDGRIRRVLLHRPNGQGGLSSFAMAVVEHYAGRFPSGWDPDKLHLINYRGPSQTFPSVSLTDVLRGRVPAEAIRNRICLVGATFAAGHDLFPTPFHSTARPDTAGIEIQASVIGNILRGDILKPSGTTVMWGFVLAGLSALSILFFRGRTWMALLLWLAGTAGWTAYALHRFFKGSVETMVLPLAVLGFAFWTQLFGVYLSERRRRREINQLFSSYVDPAAISYILKNPDQVNLRGERRMVTILTTDIEGFTRMMSTMDPELLVAHLNGYFEAITDIALKAGGMHDKFKGDSLMVIYGFPGNQTDHARRAVGAARDILAEVRRLGRQWEQAGLPILKTRIGICSGEVIMGNIGGTKRKSFTAMGDAANLSARLEVLNKELGTEILIAESTAAMIQGEFPLKGFGEIEIRGYARPIQVFTLESNT